MERKLATLVHISDLHFGDPSLEPGAPLGARVKDYWRLHERFDGYLGHTHHALEHLVERIVELRKKEPETKIITTGDVTASGAPSQFQFVKNFFWGRHELSPRDSLGLELRDSLALSIPGNHDHWPGNGDILGLPSNGLVDMWPEMPKIYPIVPLTPEVDLLLCGINSDSDTGARSPGRFFARGHFTSQFGPLGRELAKQPSNQVRVMLIHHSCAHRTTSHVEMIEGESRTALDEFIAQHRIAILLSGHVHKPHISHWSTVHGGQPPWVVMEIRCGTTTQRDTPPKQWEMSKEQADSRFSPNTLIVHRLIADDAGEIYWTATVELRSSGGFEPGSHANWPTGVRQKVWPLP